MISVAALLYRSVATESILLFVGTAAIAAVAFTGTVWFLLQRRWLSTVGCLLLLAAACGAQWA